MKAKVLSGADRFPEFAPKLLSGKRIGLLTNPTGINAEFKSTIDICAELDSVRLTALFACEHGIRGEKQAGIKFEDETDAELDIPVYSLYGKNRRPTKEMLEVIDTLLFDIQDLGVRFYTYLTTLVYVMQACAEFGKEVIVLDRPNPLGGNKVEGGFLEPGFESMVGAGVMPYQTGLTIGEFARLVNAEWSIGCELQVIPLQNWSREMEYPDTGLPWVFPSPNLPTIDTARVYPGNCLFEGTNLSEGRGTTHPFELIGAPWLKSKELCAVMNSLGLPGVHFHPLTFTPSFQKHKGELCEGVYTFVTDCASHRAVTSGLTLLHYVIQLHEEQFQWFSFEDKKPSIDLLSGSERVRKGLHDADELEQLLASYDADEQKWKSIRQPYLLYGA